MNERIAELYKQATRIEEPDGLFPREEFDPEKFALLIIKEYEKLLPDSCLWADSDQEGPMKGWHVQHVARRHFGVEE